MRGTTGQRSGATRAGGTLPAAVVANMSYSGLALARALGRRGVRVFGVGGSPHDVGMTSRFITPAIYPHILRSERDTVDALLDLAERIGEPAILFPTGDALVLPVSRHREELSPHYRFLLPDSGLVERLVSKSGLSEIIEEVGVPGPKAEVVTEPGALDRIEALLRYPAVMKPVFSASWYRQEMVDRIGHRKVVLVEGPEELRQWYERIATVDPRVIVQELVPGGDARLYYVCGYFGGDGALEAIFAGQKLRITPIHFGSASFVKSVRDERLFDAATRLLEPLGYRGLFGVELKLDPRDDTYKVIEVNVRWGLWDGLARRCGLDLGYLAYAREAGVPFEVASTYRRGVRWISMRRDLDAFLDYRREHSLTTWGWIKSLAGETEHATFAWDDLRPSFVELRAILRGKLGSVRSRIGGVAFR